MAAPFPDERCLILFYTTFFKDKPLQASFSLILFMSIEQLVDTIVPMSGFNQQISGIGSNRSSIYATSTAVIQLCWAVKNAACYHTRPVRPSTTAPALLRFNRRYSQALTNNTKFESEL